MATKHESDKADKSVKTDKDLAAEQTKIAETAGTMPKPQRDDDPEAPAVEPAQPPPKFSPQK